jgi:tetratricopeptide (TPR) repeat protein/DNA-binding XRE family transcriptional regulator
MDQGTSFGRELRRLRESAGLSLAALAARTHYSKSQLSKIENSKARPSLPLAVSCDEILHADGMLTGLLGSMQPRVPRRRHRIAPVSGIPRDTAALYGRGTVLDRVLSLLSAPGPGIPGVAGICVISGMGGVGKTALAVRGTHLSRALFPDGCLFIDLHGYSEASAVPPAEALDRLLRRLGASAESIPAHMDERAAAFRDRLEGKRVLLFLDNARDAAQVIPLLPAASGCRVLITSRSTLTSLEDAQRIRLDPLLLPDAIDLVKALAGDRLSAVGVPEAEFRAVALWCGCLPLAIRIAGACVRDEPWPDRPWLTAGDRLAKLDDGERGLGTAFEYSVQGLPASLRETFALLGLHPGPDFDATAIAALAATKETDTRRRLRQLVDASLVMPGDRPGRYFLHDLLREFARQLGGYGGVLTEVTRTEAVRRLIDYYLHTLDAADRILTPYRQRRGMAPAAEPAVGRALGSYQEALAWISNERETLATVCQLASDAGLDERCWQIAFALRGYLFITKQRELWIQTHDLAVTAARRGGDARAEAITFNNLGLAHLERGELEIAASCYDKADALFGRVGDDHGRNTALAHHAWVHVRRGELDAGLKESLQALAYASRKGLARYEAILLRDTALIEAELGRLAGAAARLLEALDMFTKLGLHMDAAMTFNSLGEVYRHLARPGEARAAFRAAAKLGAAYGSPFEEARARCGLGEIAVGESDFAEAKSQWNLALARYAALGDTGGEDRVRSRLARVRPGQ